jgi:hypothetical protein
VSTIKKNLKHKRQLIHNFTGRVKKATLAATAADFAAFSTATANQRFRACGIGYSVTTDQRKIPKGIVCADVAVTDQPCTGGVTSADVTQICLQWPATNKKYCVGDFGGPVYAYSRDTRGKETSNQLFCVTVVGNNAASPCLDGQTIICSFLPVATGSEANLWIANTIVAGK